MKIIPSISLAALLAVSFPAIPANADPDFGPNVLVFDPSMDNIQTQIDSVCRYGQFDQKRCALLFKPGTYNVDAKVGFYMQVLGLGQTPDAVTLSGLHSTDRGNVTQTFWRAAENLSATTSFWAVSQGTSFRRIHAKGGLSIFAGGWASGGFDADCKVDGQVGAGGQQQWFSRNGDFGGWGGGVWNIVFVGCPKAPTKWPVDTAVDKTPLIAEKPYLYIDDSGNYFVNVPTVATDTEGITWGKTDDKGNWTAVPTPGKSIPIDKFYIAHAGKDTAASMNEALAGGKNLLVTPGIYHLEDSINVTRPDTVVMGIGYATLIPDKGTPAITIANVDGVKVGAFLLEASTTNCPTLLQVGNPGDTASHAADPTIIYDIFARVGGAGPGSADAMVTINSNDVIGDNAWLWRADHGNGASWDGAKNKNGVIVNGNNIIYYGLAVEHTQEKQTVWNGNGGRLYFYQSEMPYDVPAGIQGFPSYALGSSVTTHQAWGLGIYSFNHGNTIYPNAIETPAAPGIKFTHMVLFKGGGGGIQHMINGVGPGNMQGNRPTMEQWPVPAQ